MTSTYMLPVAATDGTPAGKCSKSALSLLAVRVGVGIAFGTILNGCAVDGGFRQPAAQVVGFSTATPVPAAAPARPAVPASVSDALFEPITRAAPIAEPRLDLLVNSAPARDVFLAIVSDTRYSMLMHPDVGGTLSVTLRGVTVVEALEAIRDVYGYDFKIDGRRITVYPPTLQTRIFTVNYPNSQRQGSSDLRVSAGSVTSSNNSSSNVANGNGSFNPAQASGVSNGSGANSQQSESSRVSTTSKSDFWVELTEVVKGLVGTTNGRSVNTSPQAGIIAVRAMPDELRQVEKFLKAAKVAVERQVMLEAKIVEVELREGFQSGIDWSGLRNTNHSSGVVGLNGGNSTNKLINGTVGNLPGFTAPTGNPLLPDQVALPTAGSGLFGLALATTGFQAVLGFLETNGDVQILSSPRIATMNNQKAVLKVGTDEYYVTNVSGGNTNNSNSSNNSNSNTTNLPTLSLTPFFSGIALDVTPQIDDENNITLHIHPAVTTVTEKTKQIDLGAVGNYRLPLASSAVNETDTLVRLQDGNIVAIGGLMQIESNRSNSGMPGSTNVPVLSTLFGNKIASSRKKEVVVLIKPTIIRSAADWEMQTQKAKASLEDMDNSRNRVITLDGLLPAKAGAPTKP